MLALKIIAVILGIVGLVGCILPVIPGPPLSWLGLLLVFLTGPEGMTTSFLIVWLVITVVVTVLDYVAPSWITQKTGGSKAAARGTLVGLILGLIFFPPWGMIVGSFLGALISEVVFNEHYSIDGTARRILQEAGVILRALPGKEDKPQ